MRYYSYKIVRDFGFAPNPFFGYCTLACCKPKIRKKAKVGDWIIGTGSKGNNLLNELIFIMKVTEKLSFEDYWSDERFSSKKPVLNGSLVQIHGDNIYFKEKGEWCQADSHHSGYGGMVNADNLKQDLRGEYVLISNEFVYLGNNHETVSESYHELCSKVRDYFEIKDPNIELVKEFIEDIQNRYAKGVHGDPIDWRKNYLQLKLL